jgi:putative SOS response-associated peptidase YedK/ActR/RegA family two-component response regulator
LLCFVTVYERRFFGQFLKLATQRRGIEAAACMTDVRKKILCIEDDRETAKLIAEELSRRGFHPLIAYDGQVGLAAIQKRIPDLVLCDVSLPDMSGFEILAKLNERPLPHRIPFLFLTGATGRNSELQGRNLGADDYLSKPIDFDILETVVRTRLAGGIARHQIGKLSEPPRAARHSVPARSDLDHVVEVIDAPTVHLDLDKPSRDMVPGKESAAKDADHRQRDSLGSRRYEPRMCGRLAQEYDREDALLLCRAISHQTGNRISPRHTISPTETIDTICVDRGVRILDPMRWGLIPSWWKLGIAPTHLACFNARADIVATAPLFQPSGTRRHCLIPASGFYGANPNRDICHVSRRDGSIMMLAGLWDEWCNPDTRELIRSCTVVIAGAGKSAPEMTDSVPVILEPEQFDAWLSGQVRPDWLKRAGDAVIGRRLTWKLEEI